MVIVLSDEDIERMPAALRGRLMRYLASRHRLRGQMPESASELDADCVNLLWDELDDAERDVLRALHADGGVATVDRLVRAAGRTTARELKDVLGRINSRLRRVTDDRHASFCGRARGGASYSIADATWQHLDVLLRVEERRSQIKLVQSQHSEA